jgi:hypothetical protein
MNDYFNDNLAPDLKKRKKKRKKKPTDFKLTNGGFKK